MPSTVVSRASGGSAVEACADRFSVMGGLEATPKSLPVQSCGVAEHSRHIELILERKISAHLLAEECFSLCHAVFDHGFPLQL